MKCDICGRVFEPDEDDLMLEFLTRGGKSIKACQECMVDRSDEVKKSISVCVESEFA